MKKKNNQPPYNFDRKRQYLIYLNACGKKLNKKESALIGEDKFCTYEEWSEYVGKKYSYIITGSLEKFLRYLRYLLSSAEKVESSYSEVFMPIMIVYFTFLVDRFFPEGAVNNLICVALFIWFLYYLLKAFSEDSKRLLLYEDYLSSRRENTLPYLSNEVELYGKRTVCFLNGPYHKWASYGFTPEGILRLEEYYPNATKETYQGITGYIYTVEGNNDNDIKE